MYYGYAENLFKLNITYFRTYLFVFKEGVITYMSKDNRIPNKSKFKNTNDIEYKIFFKKPDKRWYGKADGVCQDPRDKNPNIFINPYLTNQSEMNTIIHELAHAFFWDKKEKDILKFSNTCSRILYERGFMPHPHSRNKQPKKLK